MPIPRSTRPTGRMPNCATAATLWPSASSSSCASPSQISICGRFTQLRGGRAAGRVARGARDLVQQQAFNSAWRAACHIAQQLGCPLNATFVWRDKEDAAFPGVVGQFSIFGR